MPGGYEIAIPPEGVRFYNTIGASVVNLAVQSGTITLIRRPLLITIFTTEMEVQSTG